MRDTNLFNTEDSSTRSDDLLANHQSDKSLKDEGLPRLWSRLKVTFARYLFTKVALISLIVLFVVFFVLLKSTNTVLSGDLFFPSQNIISTNFSEKQKNTLRKDSGEILDNQYQKLYKELVYGQKTQVATTALKAYDLSFIDDIVCLRDKKNTAPYGTSYYKNGMVRFEGGNKGLGTFKDVVGIYRDTTLWVWSAGGTKGSKLEPNQNMIAIKFQEDILKGLDEDVLHCFKYTFEDTLFDIPKDISFDSL